MHAIVRITYSYCKLYLIFALKAFRCKCHVFFYTIDQKVDDDVGHEVAYDVDHLDIVLGTMMLPMISTRTVDHDIGLCLRLIRRSL